MNHALASVSSSVFTILALPQEFSERRKNVTLSTATVSPIWNKNCARAGAQSKCINLSPSAHRSFWLWSGNYCWHCGEQITCSRILVTCWGDQMTCWGDQLTWWKLSRSPDQVPQSSSSSCASAQPEKHTFCFHSKWQQDYIKRYIYNILLMRFFLTKLRFYS